MDKAPRRYKHTPRDEKSRRLLENRINRMVGQLYGVRAMLEEGRYCGDILIQVAAVESALRNFGYQVLQEHLHTCVVEQVRQGQTEVMDETMDLIRKLR